MADQNMENPFQAFTKMMDQFRIPGVDLQAIMDGRRKDVEAVVQANRVAFQGMQALVQRQIEILQQTMSEWQKAAQGMTGKDPGAVLSSQAELAKQAIEKALANMRELAELAVKAHRDVYEVIKHRVQENLEELSHVSVRATGRGRGAARQLPHPKNGWHSFCSDNALARNEGNDAFIRPLGCESDGGEISNSARAQTVRFPAKARAEL